MKTVAAVVIALIVAAAMPAAAASDFSGRMLFAGLGVPGVTVTGTHGPRTVTTTTDETGGFKFAGLDDGEWSIKVEMTGFVAETHDVTLPHAGVAIAWTLTLVPARELAAQAAASPTQSAGIQPPAEAGVADAEAPHVITGSSINGAASRFAQARAFGNNRPSAGRLYNYTFNTQLGSSSWNARPYSFSGSGSPTPNYGDAQITATVGGPFRIPFLIKYGPQTTITYERGVTHSANTLSAVMPTDSLRRGDFSQSGVTIRDPQTGLPFAENAIPAERISPSALALLALYPFPNTTTGAGPEPGRGANFQTPAVSATTRDSFQFRLNKQISRVTTIAVNVALSRSVTDAVNLFAFRDKNRQTAVSGGLNWSRQFSTRLSMSANYSFARNASGLTPFFAGRANISGDAGISGNDQSSSNWGPPTLLFPDIADLRDGAFQQRVTKTHTAGFQALYRRNGHNFTLGGDVKFNRVDLQSQPDPRGTLTFTGAASGDAFADFLLGLPTASSLAFGNTATKLRGASVNTFIMDDWRLFAGVTVNAGVRWEFEQPFTEATGRLANLEVGSAFSVIEPVLGSDPKGPLTGASYPRSLVRADPRGIEPRLSASWRPSLTHSLVIHSGYGVYRNLGSYQPLALLLSQQPPFSRTFSIQNSPQTTLTLANPFPESLPTNANTVAIDPNLRTAVAENWDVSAQQELPASLTLLVAYVGARGSRLLQAFAPNTYPAGATNPCPTCPSGFVFVTSNGDSIRHGVQFTVRRRLYHGFTASMQYTLAKATDNAATFSNTAITPSALALAQNWLDLDAERGPSSFDQRHMVTGEFQYSTGFGIRGGTLMESKMGTLFKDWTVAGQLNWGSGMPLSPIAFSAVSGTGIVGVRPSLTGVSIAPVAPGSYANAAAFTTPEPGTWGNAGRNSIRGPSQSSFNMNIARTFRLPKRVTVEWRANITNVFNRVTFATINTVITSPQFGLPIVANPMRTIRMSAVLRF